MRYDLDELARLAAEAFLMANRAETIEERQALRACGRSYADRIRSLLRSPEIVAEAA